MGVNSLQGNIFPAGVFVVQFTETRENLKSSIFARCFCRVETPYRTGGEKVEGKALENIYFVATIKAIPERKRNLL